MAERAKAKPAASTAGRTAAPANRTAQRTAATRTGKSSGKSTGEEATMAKPSHTRTTSVRGAESAMTTTRSSRTKSSRTKSTGSRAAPAAKTKSGRSAAETERIRVALEARQVELRAEYEQHLVEIAELQRDRLTDSAGDDQADTGSKTFEREQEISLANSILERINQVERALERLDEGSYGWCERCGGAIPVERLAAFPSATLCVRCKQLEERR
jgi:RNA polymerase-binding protein DksA